MEWKELVEFKSKYFRNLEGLLPHFLGSYPFVNWAS